MGCPWAHPPTVPVGRGWLWSLWCVVLLLLLSLCCCCLLTVAIDVDTSRTLDGIVVAKPLLLLLHGLVMGTSAAVPLAT